MREQGGHREEGKWGKDEKKRKGEGGGGRAGERKWNCRAIQSSREKGCVWGEEHTALLQSLGSGEGDGLS